VGLIPPPFDFQGKKLGFNSLARADEILTYPEDGLIATVKKIKEKPDEVKRVIRAGIKANRYIRTQREGTIQFLMEWQKVNRETASANYDSAVRVFNDDGALPEAGLRLIIDEAKKTAKVEREIPPNEIADLSILREAQKELGIKPKYSQQSRAANGRRSRVCVRNGRNPRALRVLDHADATDGGDILWSHQDLSPKLLRVFGDCIDVSDGNIACPVRRHAWRLRRHRHYSTDALSTDFYDRVSHARRDTHLFSCPTEQLCVKVLGRIGIGGHQFAPTESTVGF
jgi:hypothetical protein